MNEYLHRMLRRASILLSDIPVVTFVAIQRNDPESKFLSTRMIRKSLSSWKRRDVLATLRSSSVQ